MTNTLKGFGISFLFHGAVLCSLFSMGTLLPAPGMMKVIDLSLVERPGAPQKESSAPPVKRMPPAPRPAVKSPSVPRTAKISVPLQQKDIVAKQELEPAPEPFPNDQAVAENIPEERVNEDQASIPPSETITATAPTLTPESPGKKTAAETDAIVADVGVMQELYIGANLHSIKNNIQKNITYPRLARKMSWEGKVIVSFVVDRDGKVQDVHIVESSGFTALDNNAIATIKKAAPYPCPPVAAELVVPVIYRLA